MNDFSVILVSNASSDIYQENSLTEFTNLLPRRLTLTGRWQVALQSITFDNNLSNLPRVCRNNSTAHFVLYLTGANNVERTVVINLPYTFYTPASLQKVLASATPVFARNHFFSSLTEEKNLVINLKECTLVIPKELCSWLKIDTSNTNVVTIDGLPYFYFKATAADLQLICETSKFAGEDIPQFMKLQLKEMQQTLDGKGFNQDLCFLPYKLPKGDGSLYHHEVKRKEFFNLSSDKLQDLTLCLTDEKNKKLRLPIGQATFAKLNFKNMYGSSTFHVKVASNDTSNIYPENSPSDFSVQLPHELILPGNSWEVALSSFHYPSQIDLKSVLTRDEFWIKISVKSTLIQHRPFTVSFELDNISSEETLVNSINTQVEQKIAGLLKASISTGGNLILEAGRALTLQFSPLCALVLGVGVRELKFVKAGKHFSPGSIKMERCIPHNVLLFCDIISPIIMGGKYCKILKVVQLPHAQTETIYSTYVCNHLDFLDLANDRVQVIQFHLETISGKRIKFVDNQYPSYVSLSFRKKENM